MMKGNEYPRVLILANSCLSQTNSNGRTLRNFLLGWPEEKLAQFYVKDQIPDFSVCKRFFRVTDAQALDAFAGRGARGGAVTEAEAGKNTAAGSGKRRNRNPATILLREMVWNSGRWRGCGFEKWVEEFSPQVILLQAGDSGFMLRLARELAARYAVPLVIYNSEAYYFKEHNYFRSKGMVNWLYPAFRRYFRRELASAVNMADCSIYVNEELKNAYDRAFSRPSVCIYTATEVKPREAREPGSPLRVSYLGNMGVGRHLQLVELAQTLRSVCPETHLDVYGSIPTQEVQQAFDGCPGIRCQGMVPYEQVLRVMEESDLLVHVENFSDFYRKDSKYAFSTKIADSLASGTCFLLYAPEELACTSYIAKHSAGFVATDRAQLKGILEELNADPKALERYRENALALAKQNHSSEENAAAFQRVLLSAWRAG